MSGLIAHQGGWDEALLVLLPLAIFAVLLRVAYVRAERLDDTALDDTEDDTTSGEDADGSG